MIRILQDVSHMDRAGIETILMRYYSRIDRTKFQFDFLINKNKKGAYDEEIIKLGGKLYHTPGLNPLKIIKYKKYIKKLIKDNPDIKILHAHNDAMEYPALLAAKEINFPVRISQSHNTSIDFDLKWPIKTLYRKLIPSVANYYFGCGKDAVKYFFGDKTINNNNYTIIRNAIETQNFIYNEKTRNKIRKLLNINENTFLIGHVGRFTNQKNHDFIIETMFRFFIKEPFADVKVILIGDGELEGKIKNKIKKYNMEDKFIFTGNIPNTNEYYQAIDLFILPSKYEGLPLVGIEAQTACVPCIISNKVTDEVKITNLVEFLPLDEKVWVDMIIEKMNTKHQRKDMTKQIKEKGYDIDTEVKRLESIYYDLASKEAENENSNDWP